MVRKSAYGRKNRRKGQDVWLKLIQWIGIISWVLMVPLLVLMDRAKPQFETFFDRYFDIQVESGWDYEIFRYAFYLMIFLMVLSGTGLLINKTRHKRKDDFYRMNLIIILILSILGIIYYISRVW